MSFLEELIERADLDELTRYADRVADAADWDELHDIRDDARAAAARGKQLWPITAYVNYVLALEAPGVEAAHAIEDADGPGRAAARFGLGPLTEVAASSHHFVDVAPDLDHGPAASLFAHECVARGEDLSEVEGVDGSAFDLPLRLAPWEPPYEVATYKRDNAEFPSPALPPASLWRDLDLHGAHFEADEHAHEGRDALVELTNHWHTESNGIHDATGVVGDAASALRALGLSSVRIAPVAPEEAFALMAWAGASGGAHGRRRGAAAGRFAAWWTAAALTDLSHDWPLTAEELGHAVDELHWYVWDEGFEPTGWSLRLAVEDPEHDLAWALLAEDHD